jgi:site-specific DNA recombinase
VRENAGIIARVSTSNQIDNSSPEDQLKRCREYCLQHNYNIVAERFEQISGTFVLARSGFNELLNMAADGLISVIIADVPDRLGRGDAIAKLELLAQLNGAHIEYANPGRDTSTIEGLILKQVDQLTSGMERINTRRRTKEGKRAFAQAGRVIETRFRPYGYKFISEYDARGRKTSCRLEVRNDEEPEIIIQMFEWCANEGLTTYRIAKRLTEMGIPTLGDKEPGIIKKYKGLWKNGAVYNILRNPIYIGEWYYGKRKVEYIDTVEGVKAHYLTQHAEDAIKVTVPAIVPITLFQTVQVQLGENKKKFCAPVDSPYLLRGRIRCALCGSRMRIQTSKEDGRIRRYYRCIRTEPSMGEYRCKAKSLNGKVDDLVWIEIINALLDEDRLISGYKKRKGEAQRQRTIIENTIAAIDLQYRKLEEKLNKLLDFYLNGNVDEKTYFMKKGELEVEQQKILDDRLKTEERLGEVIILTPEQEASLEEFRDAIASRLTPDVPFEEKLRLVDLLRIECVYNDETGELVGTGLIGKINCHPDQRLLAGKSGILNGLIYEPGWCVER